MTHLGYNYRLTELQASIAIPQLKRLDELNSYRIELANYLTHCLEEFDFLSSPAIREGSSHVYYLYPIQFDQKKLGISRDQFVKALNAEGMPAANYVRPLCDLPLYSKKFGFDSSYNLDNLPIVKNLWESSMIVTPICRPPLNKNHIDEFITAIKKILTNIQSFPNKL